MTRRFAKIMHPAIRQAVCLALCLLAALGSGAQGALAASPAKLPAEGDTLPGFNMDPPGDPRTATELGVPADKPFGLGDLKADLVLFEVLGVYCPQCHRQLPGFNSLAGKLRKAGLGGKVAMLGLAAGGTTMEVGYLRTKGGYAFPVVPDPDFRVHKVLGEPQTPFTMLVDKTGKVRFAHLGVIENTDELFARIRELTR